MSSMDENELKRLLEAQSSEMRRHFELTAERSDSKVDTVATMVSSVSDSARSEIKKVEEKVDRGFAETQAMIKFSHAEIDRRVL